MLSKVSSQLILIFCFLLAKHLSATNVQLDAHNQMVYNMSDTLAIQCKARDTFVACNLSMERRQILQSVLEGVEPKNFYGLHTTLNLR
jgi:hypothetical protein